MNKKYFYFILPIFMFLNFSFFKSKPTKIVFFGDSITELGEQPDGYIQVLIRRLADEKLSEKWTIEGAGIGGNKIYDLFLRYEDDVLAKKPDVVVIWVGINDVWHKRLFGTGTDIDKFEKFYTVLIKKFQAKNIKVTLVTPAVIGELTDYSNDLDGELNHYSNTIKKIAQNNSCDLIDMRSVFLTYLRANNKENKEKDVLTTDRVHLNQGGNRLVADTFYDVFFGKK
jgi:lysophospholipase L1-like esterase